MKVRRASREDAELLWKWRNDATVRASAFSGDLIPRETHDVWFASRLEDVGCRMYILEELDAPVAQVRYERTEAATADLGGISVASTHRRRGFGTVALRMTLPRAMEELEVDRIRAFVKLDNVGSAAMFEAAAFWRCGEDRRSNTPCHRYEYPGCG